MQRKMRLTRALVDIIPERVEDPGESEMERNFAAENHPETTADDIISRLPDDGDLWVFAFGSLIWKPRFPHVEKRCATIKGWQRAFCLGPDIRYRGNPDAPGLMLSLDTGGTCEGIAYRLPTDNLRENLLHLLADEPPIAPVWVNAKTAQGKVRCIAHVCPRDCAAYVGGLSEEEIAEHLHLAVGMWGSMPDYLLNTVAHLEDAGIHDPYLWRMQVLVAKRLEKIGAAITVANSGH